jgi:hypothetical protein
MKTIDTCYRETHTYIGLHIHTVAVSNIRVHCDSLFACVNIVILSIFVSIGRLTSCEGLILALLNHFFENAGFGR